MNPDLKKNITSDLSSMIRDQVVIFSKASEADYARKPASGKWSKQEILGHLIDSASNNIQRFIRGQYESDSAIQYEQDTWVRLNHYQDARLSDLIDLWRLLNDRIVRILEKMPTENFQKTSKVGNKAYTLEWLMEDYVRHLKHHLAQINETKVS
jgi:hypothetical protein